MGLPLQIRTMFSLLAKQSQGRHEHTYNHTYTSGGLDLSEGRNSLNTLRLGLTHTGFVPRLSPLKTDAGVMIQSRTQHIC